MILGAVLSGPRAPGRVCHDKQVLGLRPDQEQFRDPQEKRPPKLVTSPGAESEGASLDRPPVDPTCGRRPEGLVHRDVGSLDCCPHQ